MMKASKLLSIILAIALVFTLCAGVMAEGTDKNDSITVTGTKAGETYKLYQMFTLTVDSETNPQAYTYTITSDWNDFFTTGFGKDYVTISNGVVTWNENDNMKSASAMKALAKEAAIYADNKTEKETKQGNNGDIVFDNLDNGYYLITSTLGTNAMIETTPGAANVTINEKNPVNSITKEVKEDSKSGDSAWGSENDAQIGDTVEFKSVITLLPGTRDVVVTDTMDSGLTFNSDSIAINGLTKNNEYTVAAVSEGTFTINFTAAYLNGLTDETALELTYSATLNENAIVKNEDGVDIVYQNNKIKLTYGGGQVIEHETTTTTHKFSVFKHAPNSGDKLAGAVFSLKKGNAVVKLIKLDDNNYRVAKANETGAVDTFTTVASGDIVIWGVDADLDYTLLETDAPAGYNKLTAEVPVEVKADNTGKVDVVNNTGTELPSTGGMGTTLFYVLGAILVLGAAVILVVRRRMRAE